MRLYDGGDPVPSAPAALSHFREAQSVPLERRRGGDLWGRGPLRELPSESLFLTCPSKLWVHAEVWMNIP